MKPLTCAFSLVLIVLTAVAAFAQETERLYLSGRDKDDAVPWKFECTSGPQSGYWTNLPVPSQWEMHGFGSLNYYKDPTNAWDERGLYGHDFSIPANWEGQRVFLVFEGVMTDTSARLNGQSVGPMHQGSFYRFRYEVTGLAKFGAPNHLEVTVAKHSANASVNKAERNADYWVFGGIYRPVYLEAVPQQFIERVAIDARADGTLTAEVLGNGVSDGDSIEARILELDGRPVGKSFVGRIVDSKVTLKTQLGRPRRWTAETPNLYELDVSLKHGSQIIHTRRQRFGFRTFEVRDGDGLYLNGHRIILQGADRHSFWPESGRCLSEAIHRLDVNALKDANMNAVRMSHYPPDQMFLDLCDEMGLYVLDELGGWHQSYDTEVGTKLVHEMIARDVNHPCILFWDNGNEGGWNTNLDHLFPQLDVQHRRVLHPWAPFGGVNTAHYLAYTQAVKACMGVADAHRGKELPAAANDPTKYIYMPTEFLHGLYDGGAGAGLEDYWNLMRQSKYLGGGFIWALTDDGIRRPDTGRIDVAGNQAPDGIVGPYRQKEASYYAVKELWSPIVVTPGQSLPAVVVCIANRYSFTDAKQCRFTWQLRKFHAPNESVAGFIVLAQGKTTVPSIPPGTTNTIRLGLPRDWEKADAVAMRVEDPTGRELWTWVWPAKAGNAGKALGSPENQDISITQSEKVIQIHGGELLTEFSKDTGMLIRVQRGEQAFSLNNGPRLARGDAKLAGLTAVASNSGYNVKADFDGDLKSVQWRLQKNGWVQCDYTYTASGPMDFHGVVFDYPEDRVKHKRWLGDGPYRVWKNRLHGVSFNVWENDYNNTITGWSDWNYPEFRGCFANVRWLQLETTEGPITIVPSSGSPFVQVLTPEFPPPSLAGKTIPPLPRVGLAFLNALPPMGSKFTAASASGPQGQPNIGTGEYSGSVSFYFGQLPAR